MHGTRYEGRVADEEDPEPDQSTRTQLMAAKKGFFNAVKGSLSFPQSELSITTEETPSVLRPDSFFNVDAGKTPTLSFGESRSKRGMVTDTDSSRCPSHEATGSHLVMLRFKDLIQCHRRAQSFAQTMDAPDPSTPEGTKFTPFAAFATPKSTPEPTQKDISPLLFPRLRNVIQHPLRQRSGTKPYVKFVGFGLLDEDEDSTSLDLASNSCPKPGQRAPNEKEDLVKEVMGFPGQQVWDIDEELKKVAGALIMERREEVLEGSCIRGGFYSLFSLSAIPPHLGSFLCIV